MLKFNRIAIAAATASLCAVGLMPTAAHADDMHWIEGTVTGSAGINVRATPDMSIEPVRTLQKGETFKAVCKTDGDSVGGESTWYGIESGSEVPFYVSGRFVDVPDDFELGECGPK